MLFYLIWNHLIFQKVELTEASQSLEVGNVVVDRLAWPLTTLAEDNLLDHDILWGGEMSGQQVKSSHSLHTLAPV